MKKSRGFSLLELLIVVAIILIIATIAIPSLLRSRQAANESSAVAQLRAINTAQVTYMSGAGGEYGEIGDLISGGYLPENFSGAVAGYNYSIVTSDSATNYVVTAVAVSDNTGRFDYYSGPDGVVRYSAGTGVDLGSPVN